MTLRQRVYTLTMVLAIALAVTACSLFGGGSAQNGDIPVAIVTATPAEGTTTAPNAQPTETATPTPTLDPAFPTPVLVDTWIAQQEYQHGWAFALQDRAEIWVAVFSSPNSRDGSWSVYPDEFYLEYERSGTELVAEINETPPPRGEGGEWVIPTRGFGWLWANNQEVHDALGWATWVELGQQTTLRYDAGGLVNQNGEYVSRPGRYSMTNINGDLFVFYEDTQTFSWVPATP